MAPAVDTQFSQLFPHLVLSPEGLEKSASGRRPRRALWFIYQRSFLFKMFPLHHTPPHVSRSSLVEEQTRGHGQSIVQRGDNMANVSAGSPRVVVVD
jgi:hypothetical protein